MAKETTAIIGADTKIPAVAIAISRVRFAKE
jgi:hypothetical protein